MGVALKGLDGMRYLLKLVFWITIWMGLGMFLGVSLHLGGLIIWAVLLVTFAHMKLRSLRTQRAVQARQ